MSKTTQIRKGATAKRPTQQGDTFTLQNDSIETAHLRDLSVTRNKLADGAVGRLNVTSIKTTTYSIANTDDFVRADASSGSFTATLYSAVGSTGRVVKVKRLDQTLANAVTIATTGGQTIDGVSTKKLATQYEEITFVSDGANWIVLGRQIPSEWVSYTPTLIGFGSTTAQNFFWRRVDDSIQIMGKWTNGTVTATEARMPLPTGLTSDSTKLPAAIQVCGVFNTGNVNPDNYALLIEPSVTYMTYARAGLVKSLGNATNNTEAEQIFATAIPISGWES
jgi:hypothetical protein